MRLTSKPLWSYDHSKAVRKNVEGSKREINRTVLPYNRYYAHLKGNTGYVFVTFCYGHPLKVTRTIKIIIVLYATSIPFYL
jgi:hypothetical protein